MSSNPPPLTVRAQATSAAHQAAQAEVSLSSGIQSLHLAASSQQKRSLCLRHVTAGSK